MKDLQFKVSGLENVDKNLKELSLKVQKRIVSKAASTALEPVVEEARARCPHDTGHLAQSIGLKKIRMRGRYKAGTIGFSVGPRKGFDYVIAYSGRGIQKPFKYGVPVEYGHVMKGAFVPPSGFMRQTFINNKDFVLRRFTEILTDGVEKALAKQEKKVASAYEWAGIDAKVESEFQ